MKDCLQFYHAFIKGFFLHLLISLLLLFDMVWKRKGCKGIFLGIRSMLERKKQETRCHRINSIGTGKGGGGREGRVEIRVKMKCAQQNCKTGKGGLESCPHTSGAPNTKIPFPPHWSRPMPGEGDRGGRREDDKENWRNGSQTWSQHRGPAGIQTAHCTKSFRLTIVTQEPTAGKNSWSCFVSLTLLLWEQMS